MQAENYHPSTRRTAMAVHGNPMSCDDALHDLPQPYDISSAVSRVLRLDSFGGSYGEDFDSAAIHPGTDHPMNFMTSTGTHFPYKYDVFPLTPPVLPFQRHFSSYYDAMSARKPASLFSAEMLPELDSWGTNCESSSADDVLDPNDPQLDEFCRYIDSSGDDELQIPSPTAIPSPSPELELTAPHLFDAAPPRYTSRYLFPDYPHQQLPPQSLTNIRIQPPRKRRRTSYCEEEEAASPERPPPFSMEKKFPWEIVLESEELWREFDSVGTEMVITKNGRRMFPSLSVLVSGLEPEDEYSLHLDIVPANNKRYKFLQTEWVPVGRADKKQTHCQYTHPDSPNTGSFWMSKPVNFKLVKLTNNKATKYHDQVILNSMQRYQPCFVLTRSKDQASQTFFFPESQFIAVTAYQNSKITQLKIDHNPYARAFRECIPTEGSVPERKGGHYSKRKSSSPSPSPESNQSGGKSKPPQYSRRCNSSSSVTVCGSQSPPSPADLPENKCTSAISVESGFESGEGSCESMFLTAPPPIYPDTQILSQNNPYGCPLNYWADDNSLYNPALITPPPMLDSTSSFSEPYLQQSSQMAIEMSETVVSPVKDLDLSSTLVIDCSYSEDADDVFL